MRDFVQAPGARVRQLPETGMLTLRGALDDPAFGAALQTCGIAVPECRRIERSGAGQIAWMSPDELMVLCAPEAATSLVGMLSEALAGQHHLVAEVSSARVRFAITGPHARVTLAKLCPIDMACLQQGEIRRTRLSQVAAAVWMTGPDAFDLICFRSVADYARTALETASAHGDDIALP
jgi:sarcosine oxidase subunit gamma